MSILISKTKKIGGDALALNIFREEISPLNTRVMN